MLRPAEITDRDFLVVVHGYHKGEVREFLATVAESYAELLAKAEEPADVDDFESIGEGIASVLRAAKEAAAAMKAEAEEALRTANAEADGLRAAAETIRSEAVQACDELRAAADAALADAHREAGELRASAQAVLDDAHTGAARVEREAHERAVAHQLEAEAGVRARLDAFKAHEAAIRSRLHELGDALGEAVSTLDGERTTETVDLVDAG